MVYFLFILAVIVTVLAAIKISTYADAITRLSSVGSLFVGTFLLAGATSLPEVTTSVTAVFLENLTWPLETYSAVTYLTYQFLLYF